MCGSLPSSIKSQGNRTSEAGGLELLNVGIELPTNRKQIVHGLVEEPVSRQDLADVVLCQIARNKLLASRHVHSVHVRVTHRRAGARQIHLATHAAPYFSYPKHDC